MQKLDDFQIIEHVFDRETEKIRIYPICDLHKGDKNANIARWQVQKKKIMSEPNSYAVLLGDMLNTATKTGVSDTYNEEISPHEQKEWLIEDLADIKRKILCIMPGNHENRLKKDSDQYIIWDVARVLGLESVYRQNVAFLSIHVGEKSNKKQIFYSGLVSHGKSKTKDTKYTGFYDNMDFYVYGHLHELEAGKKFKGVYDVHNKRITFRPYAVVNASAFLDYGGYAVNALYQPSFYVENYIELDGRTKDIRVTI